MRLRLNAAEWRVVLEVADGARLLGITDAAFCAAVGISHATFSRKSRQTRRDRSRAVGGYRDFSMRDLAEMPGSLQNILQAIHTAFGRTLRLPTMADFMPNTVETGGTKA